MWLIEALHTAVSIGVGLLAGALLYSWASERGAWWSLGLVAAVIFMLAGEVLLP